MHTAVLFDLDGVFYEGDRPVPGAAEVLEGVRAEGRPHLLVTNTTSRPRSALVEKLAGFGVEVEAEAILSPVVAARSWLAERGLGPVAAFVNEATREDLADLELLPEGAERGAGAVLVGDLGGGWSFERLNRAFRLLMSSDDPVLVALGTTRYWQAEDGLRLDAGPFVAALECAAGIQAQVVGKPAEHFFAQGLARLGVTAKDAVMVGDDARADVGGAQAAGLAGVLVRTGKFRPADLDGEVRPDAVVDSVADLPAWLERRESGSSAVS